MQCRVNFSIEYATNVWWEMSAACTITEKSAVAFSLGGDNLKRYFDQK